MATALLDQAGTKTGSRWGRRIGITAAIFVGLLAAFVAFGAWWMSYVPGDLDYSTTRMTANGIYQVSYEPSHNPIPINQLHTWTLKVVTAAGEPLEHAHIAIDGDMPQHGHGLPTQPQLTEYLGDGQYLIEGVKFQMGGWWVMDFEIDSEAGTDKVRFNMLLE